MDAITGVVDTLPWNELYWYFRGKAAKGNSAFVFFYLFLSSFHAVSTHGGCSAKSEWLMSFWDHVLYSAFFFWWKRLAGSWMCCVSGHSVTALCSFSILPAFPPAGSQALCWQDVYASVLPTLFITSFPELPS